MKVLYVASEALPFVASGGLADVAGSLPFALRRRFVGARVVVPLYGKISDEMRSKMKYVCNFGVPVSWRMQYCGIFEAHLDGVIYYFIDNEYYFKRDNLYGYYDDAERFAFFSRAVLEMLKHIDFKPDIINCNDWQTGLIPVYYSLYYANTEKLRGIKTVFTIHNIQYQGQYGMEILGDLLGIDESAKSLVEYDGCVNYMKGAIETADLVSTVSRSYADEILDPWYSHGLDTILKQRAYKLRGILNGIDTVNYNPQTDKNIAQNYDSETFSLGKAACKEALQKEFSLPVRGDVPVIGIVTRLVSHKGLDLIENILDELLRTQDVQVVVLGSGDSEYEQFFLSMKGRYPDKLGVTIGFIPPLSRRIYAGSDMFLMPSKSEPCGLSQMIALRYGSVPIVRETGGLKDSITDSGDGCGNGFTFKTYNAHDMLFSIKRGIEGYRDKNGWSVLVKRAMESDNSWAKSAGEYIKMYKSLLK